MALKIGQQVRFHMRNDAENDPGRLAIVASVGDDGLANLMVISPQGVPSSATGIRFTDDHEDAPEGEHYCCSESHTGKSKAKQQETKQPETTHHADHHRKHGKH